MRQMYALALALAGLAACSIPSSSFEATPDGATPDGSSGGLAIVPSATALTVAEDATKELTVQLSQAPAAPLTVQVDSVSTAIGLSIPDMTFDETNWNQPRTIVVAGLEDQNIVDAQAEIALTATGLSPVTIATTVDDMDTIALVTSVAANNMIQVNGGSFVDVTVHLSHQPESDLTVEAVLGAGPCSVNGATRVFTPQGYDTDQTFRFTAAIDPNTVSDTQTLKLRIGALEREYTLLEIDSDTQNFAISPASLTVNEQGTAGNLNVALTQMPQSNITVSVSVVSQTGVVTVDQNQLTFTPQNYSVNQIIKVTGADDADIDNDTAKVVFMAPNVPTREVTVSINDNDSQAIETDVLAVVNVDEDAEVTFGLRLKQQPAANASVSVSSLSTAVATVTQGSLLTFTPQNYDQLQTVRVKGTRDNNLAVNQTKIRALLGSIQKEVTVDVGDIDQQEILVAPPTLSIPEGMQGSFNVSLKYVPNSTVTVSIAGTNATALPVSAAQLTFTTANFGTPQAVTLSPPVDTNNVSETSTITVSGATAPVAKTVSAMVVDGTVVETWGFPTQFPGTLQIPQGFVYAYKIAVGQVANLTTFHMMVAGGAGTFKMALYTDVANAPGTLVPNAEMLVPKVVADGSNTSNALATPPVLDAPNYWVAIRFSQTNSIRYGGPTQTGRQCLRIVNISNISDPWPVNYGSADCATDKLFNLWITTYR